MSENETTSPKDANEQQPNRWRVSLRASLVVMTLLCVFLGYFLTRWHDQKTASAYLREQNLFFEYEDLKDFNIGNKAPSQFPNMTGWGPKIAQHFGWDAVFRMSTAQAKTQRDLRFIGRAKSLKRLLANEWAREKGVPSEPVDLSPISGLTHLEELWLTADVQDLAAIRRMKRLKHLRISGQVKNGAETIANFTELEELNVGVLPINSLDALRNCSDLKELMIQKSNLIDISGLAHLKSLERLVIPRVKADDYSALAGLTSLKSLNLFECSISDLTPLSSLKNLEGLGLNGTKIASVEPLSGLQNLESLTINETRVKDLSPLANLTNLNYFEFKNLVAEDFTFLNNTKVDFILAFDTQMAEEVKLGGRLVREIDLRNVKTLKRITGLESCTSLETFDCQHGLIENLDFLKPVENLKNVFIRNCPLQKLDGLQGKMLEEFYLIETPIEDLSGLRDIRIETLYLTNNKLQDFSTVGENVVCEKLVVEGASLTSVNGIERFKGLTNLEIKGCNLKTLSPLSQLKSLRNLKTDQLTPEGVEVLKGLVQLSEVQVTGDRITNDRMIEFSKQWNRTK